MASLRVSVLREADVCRWCHAQLSGPTLIGQYQTTKTPRQTKDQQSQMGQIANLIADGLWDPLPEATPSNVFLVFFVPWWFIFCHIGANLGGS